MTSSPRTGREARADDAHRPLGAGAPSRCDQASASRPMPRYDFRKVFTRRESVLRQRPQQHSTSTSPRTAMYCDAREQPAPPCHADRHPRDHRDPAASSSPRSSPSPLMKRGSISATRTSVHLEVFPVPNPAYRRQRCHRSPSRKCSKARAVSRRRPSSPSVRPRRSAPHLEATVRLTLPAEGFTHAVCERCCHPARVLHPSANCRPITRGDALAAVVEESVASGSAVAAGSTW